GMEARSSAAPARRNRVGAVSLGIAMAGAAASRAGLAVGPFADAIWLRIVAAGFEAALVGGLADWFAVTALFRHPLGLPIPHTAIIPARRAKIVEGIVTMVEEEWLSPEVIGARLARLSPSAAIVDWLRDPAHVERLGAPLRDLLRGVARTLTEDEVAGFVERALERQLRELPLDATTGRTLARAVASDGAGAAFTSVATSLANLAARPRTAAELHWWLDRSARTLRAGGRRFVPFVLRRKLVQRKIVEAACDYAAAELRKAAAEPEHPLRRLVLDAVGRFADRLAAGDADALAQAERLRAAVLESLEAGVFVRDTLARLQAQLEHDLADPHGALAALVDRQLHAGIVELLDDPERRAAFDRWIRTTAEDLLRRHHDQIGITVRESLESLETGELVAQIESKVGADLQFIRLNGAVVGGLVGVGLAVVHWLAG
ncbi:MAG TPA: DUF445 domain-containing protein, partial [Candidatus Binatia bacterium]|nr:DUF445 domain-containing protein [Candidatus Binatia bacterium]